MEEIGGTRGALGVLGVATLGLLLLGIASPLLGGTGFDGQPRIVGSAAVVLPLLALAATARARRLVWFLLALALNPLLPALYGHLVADELFNPEAWDQFAAPPWYLLVLLCTPLPAPLYALRGSEDRTWRMIRGMPPPSRTGPVASEPAAVYAPLTPHARRRLRFPA